LSPGFQSGFAHLLSLIDTTDPGNMSRMERGLLPPPQERQRLEEYAKYLELKSGSDDWYTFFDLAAAAKGRLPDELLEDKEVVAKLPLVFRTLRRKRLTEQQLSEPPHHGLTSVASTNALRASMPFLHAPTPMDWWWGRGVLVWG